MPPHLTVAVLARDNEGEIADCLRSADWADELLVVLDARSRDRTGQIAAELGARVVTHPFHDFASQRDYGLAQASDGWLFYLDTDERATPALGREIRRVISSSERVGWWVPRRNIIWGREIRHGGWHPDYQLRLLRLGCARYDPARPVHEVVLLDGEAGHLTEPLIHHNYRTVAQFRVKQRQYIDYEARILLAEGIRPRPWTYVTQPLREFHRRYIGLRGYRDGWHGLLLCALVAYYYGFRVTVRLGALHRTGQGGETQQGGAT